MAKITTTNFLQLLTFNLLLLLTTTSSATQISTILSTLGHTALSSAAANLTLPTPITIFAPTASSLSTCPSCSTTLLLLQHSLIGLYPLRHLRSLAFATKIETLSPNHCLTITSTSAPPAKIFINGNEIANPDQFNNGLIVIHSIRGFISPLSASSCSIESMNTLNFPNQPPIAPIPNLVQALKLAMSKLRGSGYSIVAMALSLRLSELAQLESMTVFAIDDESIFVDGGEGEAYVADLGFHIVPNRIVRMEDCEIGTVLPTLDGGRSVVVTAAGDESPIRPVRINYQKVRRFDLVWNERVVVHGLSMPFRHVDWSKGTVGTSNPEGFLF